MPRRKAYQPYNFVSDREVENALRIARGEEPIVDERVEMPQGDIDDAIARGDFQVNQSRFRPQAVVDREKREADIRRSQKKVLKKLKTETGLKTTENVKVDTKVDKQLPLLPQERQSMFNTLNKMSQEQLRKYVSTFNKEARIVGGHAMKKDELINAIINKAKQVEGLLAKLRVDLPKADIAPVSKESTGTRKIAKDATGTKARETKPAQVKVGDKSKGITYSAGTKGKYLAGYAIRGNASANRFDTLAEAKKACSAEDKCYGITKEVIRGKTYYSMRAGTTLTQGKGDEESWKKQRPKTRIKLK